MEFAGIRGADIQWKDATNERRWRAVVAAYGPLGVANCRLRDALDPPRNCLWTKGDGLLRNCEYDPVAKGIRVRASHNVFDASTDTYSFGFNTQNLNQAYDTAGAEALLQRVVQWREQQNLYVAGGPLLGISWADGERLKSDHGKDLESWNRFWGLADTGSLQGGVSYQGGDLRAKARKTPELLTRGDFRVRADSAGYRAGPDGKDAWQDETSVDRLPGDTGDDPASGPNSCTAGGEKCRVSPRLLVGGVPDPTGQTLNLGQPDRPPMAGGLLRSGSLVVRMTHSGGHRFCSACLRREPLSVKQSP